MDLLRATFCVLREFGRVRLRPVLTTVLLIISACARTTSAPSTVVVEPLPPITLLADSARTTVVAPGVKHRYYWIREGPWAINVLDVDRAACWAPVAIKAGAYAVGRAKTSALVSNFADSASRDGVAIAGGVNADFFTFSPAGVPIGPHIHRGRLITGSSGRPMLAMTRDNRLVLASAQMVLQARSRDALANLAWNHPQPTQTTMLDNWFGERTDTASGAIEVVLRGLGNSWSTPPRRSHLSPSRRGVVVAVDTAKEGIVIPANGFVVYAGSRTDSTSRAFVALLHVGDTVEFRQNMDPANVVEGVGGFPMLVRNDTILNDVNTAGNVGFRGRNPRSAVGIGAGGRRLLLVTVDGRQPPYSDGMTLQELASIMRRLGATDAMNLDGGGSTTLVVRDSSGSYRIANHPSDREGERPVANALAVEHACGNRIR